MDRKHHKHTHQNMVQFQQQLGQYFMLSARFVGAIIMRAKLFNLGRYNYLIGYTLTYFTLPAQSVTSIH